MNIKNIMALVLTIAIAVCAFGFAAANAEVGTETYAEYYGADYTYNCTTANSKASVDTVILWPIEMIIAHQEKGSKVIEYYTFTNGAEWGEVAMAVAIEAGTGYAFAIVDTDNNAQSYDMSDAEDILAAIEVITNWVYAFGYVNGTANGNV